MSSSFDVRFPGPLNSFRETDLIPPPDRGCHILFRTSRSVALLLAFQFFPFLARSTARRDTWRVVSQLPHRTSFTFLEHDRTCHFGQVESVSDQRVIINTGKSKVPIDRSNLLYVQRGHIGDPYGRLLMMYSGRSSWSDVLEFMPPLRRNPSLVVRIAIATISGKSWKGTLADATDAEILVRDSFGKETQVPKSTVSRVDYIQSKPLSDNQEFDWEELAMLRIFDPALYPRLFHAGDTIPIRLYDRALMQDDSLLECS